MAAAVGVFPLTVSAEALDALPASVLVPAKTAL
jgi:hypothetical protein